MTIVEENTRRGGKVEEGKSRGTSVVKEKRRWRRVEEEKRRRGRRIVEAKRRRERRVGAKQSGWRGEELGGNPGIPEIAAIAGNYLRIQQLSSSRVAAEASLIEEGNSLESVLTGFEVFLASLVWVSSCPVS